MGKVRVSGILQKRRVLCYHQSMYSTYVIDTDELTPQFITALQQAYPKKRIEIFVQETQDETEYLLNDKKLLKAVEDIKNGKNLVSVSLDSLP